MNDIRRWFCKLSRESLNELQLAISNEMIRRDAENQESLRNQTLTPTEKVLLNQKMYVPTVKSVRLRTGFSLADSKFVVDNYLSMKFAKPFTGYAGFDDEGNPVTREELDKIKGT